MTTENTTLQIAGPALETPPRWLEIVQEMISRPEGLFSLALVSLLMILIIFAPLIAPYDPAQQDIKHRLEGPSSEHWLGTDHLGRDLFSRLVFGTRVALGTAFPSVLSAVIMGVVLGLAAGYLGGNVDNVILVVMDTLQAFPAIILTLALLALLGASATNVIVVIAIAYTPGYARIVRAQVLAFKEHPFVEVERSLGARDGRIVFVHILPNILAPLVILLAMDLPTAITTEAGLSFLGLGVKPPTPSWGIILADGFAKIRNSPWPVVWASLTLMITTLGFTLFGEALRDVLDPKLAGTRRA
ncbi:MAG: ABC transporter permease [Anaerolineales bacterium]|nr:ABC transporter permease [Anaerolineales bacterium]